MRTRRLLFIVVWLVLVLQIAGGNSSPPRIYAALGDSLAAGAQAGGGSFFGQPQGCEQSVQSYAVQFNYELNPGRFLFLACRNATIDQVRLNQVPKIPANADLVSITVGSMDIGFATIIENCDLYPDPAEQGLCNRALTFAESQATDRAGFYAVYTSMQYLIGSIRNQAPNAMIVILGFAKPIGNPVQNCYLHNNGNPRNLETTMDQKNWLNKIIQEMNDSVAAAAKWMMGANGINVKVVDADSVFDYHRFCDAKYSPSGTTWLQYLTTDYASAWDSGYYLPNAFGHYAYKDLLKQAWEEGSPRAQNSNHRRIQRSEFLLGSVQ